MRVKNIIWEDTVNYRVPCLFIGTSVCSFKCGPNLCQNSALARAPTMTIENDELIRRYQENPLTEAIVFGGLEPLDQLPEIAGFCAALNQHEVTDDLVIYTGYEEKEVATEIDSLRDLNRMRNLVVKYGRFLPDRPGRRDDILGVTLVSDNQYAVFYPRQL